METETDVRENEEGYRAVDGVVSDVDDSKHEVAVRYPHEVLDGYRTDWAKGCWSESLAKLLPPMVFNHEPSAIIGRGIRSEELSDSTQIIGKFASFDDVPKAREAFALTRDGMIPGWSFHFRNARSVPHPNVRGARRFVKADMMEFGPVTFPAIPGAEAVGLRAQLLAPVQVGTVTQAIPLETILKLGEDGHLDEAGVRALIEEHYPQLTERIVIRTPQPSPEERIAALLGEHAPDLLDTYRAMTITVDPTNGNTTTDGDEEDPQTLIRGIDACLDAASDALGDIDRTTLPDNVQQALALVDAAGVAVDELQDILGIDDPDEPGDGGRSLEETGERAAMSTKEQNKLSDDDFAYIDSKGGRHLPVPDAAHVRNALARFDQTDFESDEAKQKAKAKVLAAAKKFGVDASENKGSRSLDKEMERTLERLNRRVG